MDRKKLHARLIGLAVQVTNEMEVLERSDAGWNIKKQIIRSSMSCALNYAEAIDGESRKDFKHKLKIVLKELRETHTALIIIKACELSPRKVQVIKLIQESNELISIFVVTLRTLKQNDQARAKS